LSLFFFFIQEVQREPVKTRLTEDLFESSIGRRDHQARTQQPQVLAPSRSPATAFTVTEATSAATTETTTASAFKDLDPALFFGLGTPNRIDRSRSDLEDLHPVFTGLTAAAVEIKKAPQPSTQPEATPAPIALKQTLDLFENSSSNDEESVAQVSSSPENDLANGPKQSSNVDDARGTVLDFQALGQFASVKVNSRSKSGGDSRTPKSSSALSRVVQTAVSDKDLFVGSKDVVVEKYVPSSPSVVAQGSDDQQVEGERRTVGAGAVIPTVTISSRSYSKVVVQK
jgi:hypothetical protein